MEETEEVKNRRFFKCSSECGSFDVTLLCAWIGGQKLTRFGPACVSGMLALARLVRVWRTPHSLTLCRSLRSSQRSSSDGLHWGGGGGRRHGQSSEVTTGMKVIFLKISDVPFQSRTLWHRVASRRSAGGPSLGLLGVQVFLRRASAEWLKREQTNQHRCVYSVFFCMCERRSIKSFIAPEEAERDRINGLQWCHSAAKLHCG